MDMQLFVELYFIEKDYSYVSHLFDSSSGQCDDERHISRQEKMSTMQQLCSRSYKLHFNPRLGIHTHVPVVFDYFHLSALTMTIHGSLLCLIPPYVFDRYEHVRLTLSSFARRHLQARRTTNVTVQLSFRSRLVTST